MGSSPQAAASPHLTASPQVPSPQGQTLDLSVNRLHRCVVSTMRTKSVCTSVTFKAIPSFSTMTATAD